METALFSKIMMERSKENDAATAIAEAWLDPTQGLKAVALYASRIQLAIEKNTADLKSMQSERNAAYAKVETEAILLTRLAHAKGQCPM